MGDKVRKIYLCSMCKKNHTVIFDSDLAKTQTKFPFEYFHLHRFETEEVDEKGADILSTLFIDANLNIRGAESYKLVRSDIVSKDDTHQIVNQLMEEIQRVNAQYEQLLQENVQLKEKIALLEKK